MKRLALLLLLTGLLACQEPVPQPGPGSRPVSSAPEPSILASQTPEPVPIESSHSLPSTKPEPTPTQTPGPQPTPVQKLEVLDITPPEFLDASQGYISAFSVDSQAKNPYLFANYNITSGDFKHLLGMWVFQAGQQPRQLDHIFLPQYDDFSTMQYHHHALYVRKTEEKQVCIKRYDLETFDSPSDVICFPRYDHLWFRPEFKVHPNGDIYIFNPFLPELNTKERISTSAYQIIQIKNKKIHSLLAFQAVGVNRILQVTTFMEEGLCWGICYLPQIHGRTSGGGTWTDLEADIWYVIGDFRFSPSVALNWGLNQKDRSIPPWLSDDENIISLLPENDHGRVLLLKDGPPEKVTFWRPAGLDMDRQGNFYVQDRVAQDFYIRQIAPDGTTTTLVSANGLTKFGYPESKASMKSVLPSEQQVHDIVELSMTRTSAFNFLVDYHNDLIYIQSYHLYRFDLRTQQLELLALEYLPDIDIKVNQLVNLNIDAEGHLYATHGSHIFKILIPQPEGRR